MATRTSTATSKATKAAAALQAPSAAAANPFAAAAAQLAARGSKQATQAATGVASATSKPAVGTIAPVGVATRNAGQATTMQGFALVGVNGRKQPLASSVTAAIWQAAMAYQVQHGTMPTQAHIKLACPTVNPTSCGLGLTQYKAYTGQTKGTPVLTPAQLQALAAAAK